MWSGVVSKFGSGRSSCSSAAPNGRTGDTGRTGSRGCKSCRVKKVRKSLHPLQQTNKSWTHIFVNFNDHFAVLVAAVCSTLGVRVCGEGASRLQSRGASLTKTFLRSVAAALPRHFRRVFSSRMPRQCEPLRGRSPESSGGDDRDVSPPLAHQLAHLKGARIVGREDANRSTMAAHRWFAIAFRTIMQICAFTSLAVLTSSK